MEETLTLERWKNIPGYFGKYHVSSLGRVKSLAWSLRPYNKVLSIKIDKHYGYVYVDLWKNNKPIRKYVHSLMLRAFVGPKCGRDSRHLDDIKTNNVLTNLKYGTCSENMKDSWKNNPKRSGFKKGHPYGLRFGYGQKMFKHKKGHRPWNKNLNSQKA